MRSHFSPRQLLELSIGGELVGPTVQWKWESIAKDCGFIAEKIEMQKMLRCLFPECQAISVNEMMEVAKGQVIRGDVSGNDWRIYAMSKLEAEIFNKHAEMKAAGLMPSGFTIRNRIDALYRAFGKCKHVIYKDDRVFFEYGGVKLVTDRIWTTGALTSYSVVQEGWTLFLRSAVAEGWGVRFYLQRLIHENVVVISRNGKHEFVCVPRKVGELPYIIQSVTPQGEKKCTQMLYMEMYSHATGDVMDNNIMWTETKMKSLNLTETGKSSMLALESVMTHKYPWKTAHWGETCEDTILEVWRCCRSIVPPELIRILESFLKGIEIRGRTQEKDYAPLDFMRTCVGQEWYHVKQTNYAYFLSQAETRYQALRNSCKGEVYFFRDLDQRIEPYTGYLRDRAMLVAVPRIDEGLMLRICTGLPTLDGDPEGNFRIDRKVGHQISSKYIPMYPSDWTVWEIRELGSNMPEFGHYLRWAIIYDYERVVCCRPFQTVPEASVFPGKTELMEIYGGVYWAFGKREGVESLKIRAKGMR